MKEQVCQGLKCEGTGLPGVKCKGTDLSGGGVYRNMSVRG